MAYYTRSGDSIIGPERFGLLHKGRVIFKVGGAYFYKSSGLCSNLPGMVFPFYGIAKTGWFIKPQGKHICWGLGSPKLSKVREAIKQMEFIDIDVRSFLSRFSNLEQMYVSFKYGHTLWEGPVGKMMERDFGFDPKLYGSFKLPDHLISEDNILQVNKWLKKD
jgi:hypothetical protein